MGAAGAGASIGLGLVGSYMQGQAYESEAKYNMGIAENNAKLMDMQAEDVQKRGQQDQYNIRSQTKQLKGSQRAALAAQGIFVDSGSAAELQLDTDLMGEIDERMVRINAMKESYGIKMQAQNLRNDATAKLSQAKSNKYLSYLSGGASALDRGSRYLDGKTLNDFSKPDPAKGNK